MRDEQIALIPRHLAAKKRPYRELAKYRRNRRTEPGWTIRPADGITAQPLHEPAKP